MADASTSVMTMDLRSGDALAIAGTRVEFIHKSGRLARLRVTAPRDMPIKKIVNSGDDSSPVSRAKHGYIAPA